MSQQAQDAVQLVRRIRAGERSAEDELIRAYGPGIRRLLRRMTSTDVWDDDLFQETFRLALKKLRAGELREPCKLPGFIHRMARNLFIAEYRKKARRIAREAADLPSYHDRLIDPAPSPLVGLIQREEVRRAQSRIRQLPSLRHREVLRRLFFVEESRDEICRALGMTKRELNHALYRARRHLRAGEPSPSEAPRP